MNVESAFCDVSLETTSGNERGVALPLADAYADTMDATAKVAITSMLAATIRRSASSESLLMSAT